jgi:hypothetical protein
MSATTIWQNLNERWQLRAKRAHPSVLQLLDNVRRRRADGANEQRRSLFDDHVDHLVEAAEAIIDIRFLGALAGLDDEDVDTEWGLGIVQIRFEFADALTEEFGGLVRIRVSRYPPRLMGPCARTIAKHLIPVSGYEKIMRCRD